MLQNILKINGLETKTNSQSNDENIKRKEKIEAIANRSYFINNQQLKIKLKMNKIEQLNLIEGNFSDEEAKEILMSIFLAKINFHEKKIFSSQIRFGKDDEIAVDRIPKLKKETEKMLQIISEAKLHNKRLLITSKIDISLVD